MSRYRLAVARYVCRIVEKLGRDRIVRRLPVDFGNGLIFLSPDAMLKYWRRDVAASGPAFLAAAKKLIKPRMRAWDVGANGGIFTFAAQFLVGTTGHVLAVEADPWVVSLLQRSRAARVEASAEVHLLCAAVAQNVGLARFNIAARGRAASALNGAGITQMGELREALVVPFGTLDMLLTYFSSPHVVKIDIDGAEGLAFAAADKFLETRPILIIEASAANAEYLSDLLKERGCRLFEIAVVREAAEIQRAAPNTIAIPPCHGSDDER